jgi:hypothetical protein
MIYIELYIYRFIIYKIDVCSDTQTKKDGIYKDSSK